MTVRIAPQHMRDEPVFVDQIEWEVAPIPELDEEEKQLRELERRLGWSTRQNVHDSAVNAYMKYVAK